MLGGRTGKVCNLTDEHIKTKIYTHRTISGLRSGIVYYYLLENDLNPGRRAYSVGNANSQLAVLILRYPSGDGQQMVGLYWFVAQQNGTHWTYVYLGLTFTG